MLKKLSRFFRWSLGGIALVYAFAIYGGFAPMPFKVTDPNDPRFNVERFRFEDYPTSQDLSDAVRVILPIGTPLEKVDHVLVKIGGAKKSGPLKAHKNPEHVSYLYSKWTLWRRFLKFCYSLSPNEHQMRILIEAGKEGNVSIMHVK